MISSYKVLVTKPKQKRLFRRFAFGYEINISMVPAGICCVNVE
jgi:hypothetical protein